MVYLYNTVLFLKKIIEDIHNSSFCTLKHLFTQDYDLFDINPGQKQNERKIVLFWKKSHTLQYIASKN